MRATENRKVKPMPWQTCIELRDTGNAVVCLLAGLVVAAIAIMLARSPIGLIKSPEVLVIATLIGICCALRKLTRVHRTIFLALCALILSHCINISVAAYGGMEWPATARLAVSAVSLLVGFYLSFLLPTKLSLGANSSGSVAWTHLTLSALFQRDAAEAAFEPWSVENPLQWILVAHAVAVTAFSALLRNRSHIAARHL